MPPERPSLDPVTVTEAAKSYLATQLEEGARADLCFRLRTDSSNRMATDVTRPEDSDVLVRHHGEVVLAIEPDLATRLRDSTIDIERKADRPPALIVL